MTNKNLGKRITEEIEISPIKLYPSNLYEIDGATTTKNIYAGDQLIATKKTGTVTIKEIVTVPVSRQTKAHTEMVVDFIVSISATTTD